MTRLDEASSSAEVDEDNSTLRTVMAVVGHPKLRAAILLGIGVFFVWLVTKSWSQIVRSVSEIGPGTFTLAVVIFTLSAAAAFQGWYLVLRSVGEHAERREALEVFAIGQIGKYLPGGVWVPMLHVEVGRRLGLRARGLATGSVIHALFTAVVGLLVGVWAVPTAASHAGDIPWFVMLLAAPLLLLFVPRVFSWIIERLTGLAANVSGRSIAHIVAWTAASFVLQGLQLLVITSAIVPSSGLSPVVVVAAFALSWSIGFLFLPAPAGAGVREAVLIAVLAASAPAQVVVGIALISRAANIVSDVLVAVLGGWPLMRRLCVERIDSLRS